MKHPHLAATLAVVLAVAPLVARADGPQQVDVARTAWTRGTRTSRRILSLLDEARRVGDHRRAACLDDALSRADSQLRLIETRTERLERAKAAHDTASAARELRLLQTVARRLPEVEIFADACVGIYRHAGLREETTVEMTAPTDLPADADVRY